jgi:putative flippase GtrA
MTLAYVLQKLREKFALLLRYGIVGAFGAFLQTSFLYVWVSVLEYRETYLLGAFFGFLTALIVSFVLQKFWTFRDSTLHRTHKQFVAYGAVAVLNVLINIVLLALVKELFEYTHLDFFDGWYLVAQVVIVCIASGTSFLFNYFLTFRDTLRGVVSEELQK